MDGRRDLRDPRRGCGPWALVDLAEAAAGGNGNRDAARRRCAELIPEAATTGSPLLRASVALAAPMLATEDAQALFDAAFDADLATWPLHRARLQLAYGMWLRRRQQAGDSRAPLRAARDTFDAIGAEAWTERARRELCAAGERSDQRSPKAWTCWPRKSSRSRGWPQKG